jgi:acyl-CoA hydrolase
MGQNNKQPITRKHVRRLALERAINAMEGDIAGGGFVHWLDEQGYSVAEMIQIEQAYATIIVEVQAKLDGSTKDQARATLMKRYEPTRGSE